MAIIPENQVIQQSRANLIEAANVLADRIEEHARIVIPPDEGTYEIPNGFHLGYSRIQKYRECPRKFKYCYVDGLRGEPGTPLKRGQAYHGTLEELLKYKLETGKLMDADKADRLAVKCAKKEKLSDVEIYHVIDAVRFYYTELYPKHKPVAVELPFTYTRGGQPFTGRIDLITEEGYVIDHKFSYDTWAEDRSRYGCQPIVYQWAGLDVFEGMFADKGWKFKGFQYNIIRLFPSPKIQVITIKKLNEAKSQWWEDQVALLADGMIRGFFPAYPEEKACKYCDYKDRCKPVIYSIDTADLGKPTIEGDF